MYPVKHISVSIKRSPEDVYEFTSNPKNLPLWAAGLSGASIEKRGDAWICDSPMGQVQVKFAEKNSFGVMDHDVTLYSGEVNHNPFRVLANGRGAEVIFTLFKLPRMSAEDYDNDARLVTEDLNRLKMLLER